MDIAEERATGQHAFQTGVNWSSVIAGAVAAAALSLLLLTFGAGIGLAISSTAPTSREISTSFVVVSAAWLIFSALLSFGLGGYISGRLRGQLTGWRDAREMEFWDGMQGLVTWGLVLLIGGVIALATSSAFSRANTSADSAMATTAGEASLAYEVDQLFRTERASARSDLSYARAEAARILLMSDTRAGIPLQDRNDLVRMVVINSALSPSEADSRVGMVIAEARQALRRAREAAVTLAFSTATALLIGAIVAWYSAREGGREREAGGAPSWRWSVARIRAP